MKLSLKPVRASRAPGFQGHYGGSQLVLTLYRMRIFCFQMCNRLPKMMKNGDAGIFPVYYSLNDRGAHLLTVDIWEQPLSVGPYIFLCEANEE